MSAVRALAFLLSLLLLGCATGPAEFGHFRAPPNGMAVIVIYRVDDAPQISRLLRPNITVNGRASWPLPPDQYLQEVVPPGPVTLLIERQQFEGGGSGANWRAATDATVELIAKPDNTYFVELQLGFRSFSFRQTDVVAATTSVRGQRARN